MMDVTDNKSHIVGLSVKNGPAGQQPHEIGLISRDRLIVPVKSAKDQRLVTYDIDSDDDSVEILNTSTLPIQNNTKERQKKRPPRTENLEVDCDVKDFTSCGSSPNADNIKPTQERKEEKCQPPDHESSENERLKRLLLKDNDEDLEEEEEEEDSTPDLQLIRPGSSKYSSTNYRRKFCPTLDKVTCCKLQ